MPYVEYRGNLFASKAQTLVNTVNCVGAMGKGVALEFRRRYPEMYQDYREVCARGALRPGEILLHAACSPWILNIAVKDHWRFPSRLTWVEACLQRFCDEYQMLGITSIAFPWIGAMNGGLPWHEVHSLMRRYLAHLPGVDIEVVEFDPHAPDPLFDRFKRMLLNNDSGGFARSAGITGKAAETICDSIQRKVVNSMAELCAVEGLSKACMDRVYEFARDVSPHTSSDPQLRLVGI